MVNITASILLGVVSGFVAHVAGRHLATGLQQFLAVGVCGGLSTFSSVSLQTWNLLLERRWLAAILNILVSNHSLFCWSRSRLAVQRVVDPRRLTQHYGTPLFATFSFAVFFPLLPESVELVLLTPIVVIHTVFLLERRN